MTTPYPLDYPALQHRIAVLTVSVAELHGGLCGFLCAGGQPQPGRWLDQLCIDPRGLDDGSRDALEQLRRATTSLLDDPELQFTPLLPDDDQGMAQRVAALGQWCTGFLGGYGLHGDGAGSDPSSDASDALRDLDRIAHFGYEAGEDEEDEAAFAEILEYVRIAVLLLHQDAAGTSTAPHDATRH